jgi:hypothetical protein
MWKTLGLIPSPPKKENVTLKNASFIYEGNVFPDRLLNLNYFPTLSEDLFQSAGQLHLTLSNLTWSDELTATALL